MSEIQKLARKTVQALTPYLSARRIGGKGDVWLNANESPDCNEYQLDCHQLNRYPEFQPPELINAYAEYAAIKNTQVLCTRGADESIEVLIRTFCEPGDDSILICPPTYGMYAISAETCGVNIKEIPLQSDFNVDYQAVEQAINAPQSNVKIAFLCAPNNPTGNMIDADKLIALLQATLGKALIVVDEAYIEFCAEQSHAALIAQHENLVITRTLSKAFALASIRCGFTLAQETVIEMLSKVIAPYPVPSPVAQIATQALTGNGLSVMYERVKTLNNNRQLLKDELAKISCVTEIFPATGNYVLVRFEDSAKIFAAFANNGIVMRDFANKPRLENCIRITIGTETEIQTVLTTLNSL